MKELLVECEHPRLCPSSAAVEALARRVLEGEGYGIAYLGIILTGHDVVHRLNQEYLGKDAFTDVLAFSLSDADEADAPAARLVDGEVYVDLDTAEERAPEFGAEFDTEVRRYVVHGLLHLVGYDDHTPEGKAEMHRLEDRYLAEP